MHRVHGKPLELTLALVHCRMGVGIGDWAGPATDYGISSIPKVALWETCCFSPMAVESCQRINHHQ